MKILIVEDDHLQVQWIVDKLSQAFPQAQIDVVSTELGFRLKLPQILKQPPNVVVMDVMLRWTDPGPNLKPPPEDVKTQGFFRAGLRCADLLSAQTQNQIPIILYTVLEHSDVASHLKTGNRVFHLRKDSASEALVQEILSLVRKQA